MAFRKWLLLLLFIFASSNCIPTSRAKRQLLGKKQNWKSSLITNQINLIENLLSNEKNPPRTTQDYYHRLLGQVHNQDTALNLDTLQNIGIKPEQLNSIINSLKSTAATQQLQPYPQQPYLPAASHPLSIPSQSTSLLDFLSSQSLSRPEIGEPPSVPIRNNAPNASLPTLDTETPYIPAIHGSQILLSNPIPSSNPPSVLNISLDTTNTSNQQQLNLPVRTASAINTRLNAADIDKCLKQVPCILSISLLGALGFTSALGFGFLFTGKRKKRNADILFHQKNIIDLINRYQSQITGEINEKEINDFVLKLIRESYSPETQSRNREIGPIPWGYSEETLLPKAPPYVRLGKRTNQNSSEQMNRSETDENNMSEIKGNIMATIVSGSRANDKNLEQDQNLPLRTLPTKPLTPQNDLKINQKFTDNYQASEERDEVVVKPRSDLASIFSQLERIKNDVNLSSNYENQTEISQVEGDNLKTQKDSLISTLNFLFNTDSKRNITKIGNTELIQSSTTNPSDNYSSSHNNQNLQLNQNTQSESSTKTRPRPVNSNLMKLITQNNKLQNPSNDKDLGSLIELYILNQFNQKPSHSISPTFVQSHLAQTTPVPISSNTNTKPNLVPVNTVAAILQNPNNNQTQVQSTLSKLITLISEAKPKPAPPAITNPSPFTSTVFQTPQTTPTTSPIIPVRDTSSQQKLRLDTLKFYRILCQSILQPNVPLNKVTAYIAEKCLVMRFLNVLRG